MTTEEKTDGPRWESKCASSKFRIVRRKSQFTDCPNLEEMVVQDVCRMENLQKRLAKQKQKLGI